MELLQELLQLNEAVKMREDGVYKHPSGMCEVHVDANDPEDGVRGRVLFKSVDYDDEEQLDITREKYMKFVTDVFAAYDLDIHDAQTHDPEEEHGHGTVIYIDFPPEDLD